MSRIGAFWWLLGTIAAMAWAGVFCYHIGKQQTDRWYAEHPVYQMLGTSPGNCVTQNSTNGPCGAIKPFKP